MSQEQIYEVLYVTRKITNTRQWQGSKAAAVHSMQRIISMQVTFHLRLNCLAVSTQQFHTTDVLMLKANESMCLNSDRR